MKSVLGNLEERYFGEWNCWQDVLDAFTPQEEIEEPDVIYAYYSYEDYSGFGIVVYRLDERYYLVEGSHCSCYGLENQWNPTEYIDKNELTTVMNKSWRSYKDAVLEALEKR